jgi:hypothetical protein
LFALLLHAIWGWVLVPLCFYHFNLWWHCVGIRPLSLLILMSSLGTTLYINWLITLWYSFCHHNDFWCGAFLRLFILFCMKWSWCGLNISSLYFAPNIWRGLKVCHDTWILTLRLINWNYLITLLVRVQDKGVNFGDLVIKCVLWYCYYKSTEFATEMLRG